MTVGAAVHESFPGPPFGWTQSSQAVDLSANTTLQAWLQYANLDQLEPLLEALSTPGSPQYGQWINLAEQNRIFAPPVEAQNRVQSWLESFGITDICSDGSVLTFTTSISIADSLLNTSFAYYTNGERTELRTLEYSLPDDLLDVLDFITPTTYFGNPKGYPQGTESDPALQPAEKRSAVQHVRKRQTMSPSCTEVIEYQGVNYTSIQPQCYQQQLNTGQYQVDASAGSTIAITSFLNQTASYSDLALFEAAYDIPDQNFTKVIFANGETYNLDDQSSVDSTGAPSINHDEANMELQIIIGLVGGLPVTERVTIWSDPGSFVPDVSIENVSDAMPEPYVEFFRFLLSQENKDLAYVISNSYGRRELTYEKSYARRVCNMIGNCMLGLRGRTILTSSGDQGVGAACRANTGAMQAEFVPTFPGMKTVTIAVNRTQELDPPTAMNRSGGGFSNFFPQAFYQKPAIDAYLSQGILPEAKEYFASNNYTDFLGRGYPDLAADMDNPRIAGFYNGERGPNGGTSASAPAVAAVIALLNDVRLRAGKPALGFINPLIYALKGEGFTDITRGSTVGCNGSRNITGQAIIPYAGWNATEGWDPTTGWGIPNFGLLKDIVLKF
ncbi:uncharacterized protein MYCGRDRAFT_50687 [Zymoseptoria tritici IPO323]|uniref:Peptidase S53 domain-containing protein n=1 Tax=Zymoseptoria tritici (strain CBS 115943 / IPO323) TaxID=336722 RepID=F9XNQ0_ZYMTI|nr:uncharacterized protein MYCGRDRAFT_50687 [Zymoseptoria tritici IPO323]EGP82911.1 hypothetical protein MYCGRDRAFT_50687 [Zymoseptoria tritici IPO323]